MHVLASVITFAQEHGGEAEAEPSGTDLILPAIDELLWGAIAFGIVLYILTKKAFPILRKTVEAREQQIQSDLEGAENAKAEAEQAKAQYDRQIADARGEANRIIEEARQSAEQVRKDLIAKAEKDAAAITARAEQQIGAERQRTMQELQGTIGKLSIDLAEKVVGRSIDASSQKEFVDSYIRDVAGMSGANGGSSN